MLRDQESINEQLELLAAHRRTLAHLLEQAAAYGGIVFTPPQTANGIEDARANISRITTILRETGIQVEDEPNDEAAPLTRPVHPPKPFEPETILIPDGKFLMGSDGGDGVRDDEKPHHEVILPDYYISKYPVTNTQYLEYVRQTNAAVAGEAGWVLAHIGQEPPEGREKHPMVGMSWDEAVAYCEWLSKETGRRYRLPSEAEWEKAARGTDGRRYPWGDDFDPSRCNSIEAGSGATTPVDAYSPQGDSVYGCSDMVGNVWEWTSTIWGLDRAVTQFRYPYRADDKRDLMQLATPYRELRICRGGAYHEQAARVTCTARSRQPANSRAARRGFRVVIEI